MLYIVVKHPFAHPGAKQTYDLGWHVGKADPLHSDPDAIHRVVEVQADGDELVLITRTLDGIPMAGPASNTVRWFGDHAKFIAANLPHQY